VRRDLARTAGDTEFRRVPAHVDSGAPAGVSAA